MIIGTSTFSTAGTRATQTSCTKYNNQSIKYKHQLYYHFQGEHGLAVCILIL